MDRHTDIQCETIMPRHRLVVGYKNVVTLLIRAHFKGTRAEDCLWDVFNDPCVICVLIFFTKEYIVGTHLNCLDKFTKAYVVGTHWNCIDKSMQF